MHYVWACLLLITCQTCIGVVRASSPVCLDEYGCDVMPSSSPSLPVSLLQTKFSLHSGTKSVGGDLSRAGHVSLRRLLGNDILTHQGVYDNEVELYARHYHELFHQSSMIFFPHVSKSAGTTLCHAGAVSKCRTRYSNCHVAFDNEQWTATSNSRQDLVDRLGYSLTVAARPGTCAGLAEFYSSRNLTLEGNENFLIDEGLCSEFWNVMVARDPMKRLMSHLAMLTDDPNEFQLPANFSISSPSELFKSFPIVSNNYYIRVLLGAEVFALPFGSITLAHLEKAKRIIEGFDVLLVVDEHDETALVNEINATLGLDAGEREMRGRGTDSFSQNLNWTDSEWESVRNANALDFALWQHVQHLHAIDQQVFGHPAFSKLSAAMPRASCGYLSK